MEGGKEAAWEGGRGRRGGRRERWREVRRQLGKEGEGGGEEGVWSDSKGWTAGEGRIANVAYLHLYD